MKKYIYSLVFCLAGLLAVGVSSCKADYETEFEVKTLVVPDESLAPINFDLNGGSAVIKVNTNVELSKWVATSNADWCVVEKKDNQVTVSAGENNIYQHRVAVVDIYYGHQAYSIQVVQMGKEPAILIGENNENQGFLKVAEPSANTLDIPIITNLDIDNVVIPDTARWVHFEGFAPASRAENTVGKILKLRLDQNTDTIQRFCSVILQSSQNYSYKASFTIRQEASGYLVMIDKENANITVPAAGRRIEIPFQINGPATAPYSYVISDDAKAWIIPVPQSRALRDARETFDISPNIVEAPRKGSITFTSKDGFSKFVVNVEQDKFVPVPPFNVKNLTATPNAGYITLNWERPEEVNYTQLKIFYYDPVTKENVVKEINDNRVMQYVIGETFAAAGEYTFTIKSYGPTGMETNDPVIIKATSNEVIEVMPVKLTLDMLSANATATYDGGGLPALIDGKKDPFYHTHWKAQYNMNERHYIQFNLPTPMALHHIEYDGRQGSNPGDVKRADILIATSATSSEWNKVGTLTFALPNQAGAHILSDVLPRTTPSQHIRFTPTAKRSADPIPVNTTDSWFNMGEIYLYQYNPYNSHSEDWARHQMSL